MKVKKLKEILSKYKDNEDIYIYNGLVDDFVDIKEILQDELVKTKSEVLKESLIRQNERFNINKPIPKKIKGEWELKSDFIEYSFDKFDSKNILLICPKLKNKQYFDRIGDINY